MPSALREALFAQGASRTLVKGEILFTRRDPPDAVYFVRTGSLEALDDRSRPPAVLATLGPSSVVGEVAFIDGAPRAATVQACEPTTLLAWSREALLALAEGHPRLGSQLWQGLAGSTVDLLRTTLDRAGAAVGSVAEGVEDDLEGAVHRLSSRLVRTLDLPPPDAGPGPLGAVVEGLGAWLQRQGDGAAGLAAGDLLRAGGPLHPGASGQRRRGAAERTAPVGAGRHERRAGRCGGGGHVGPGPPEAQMRPSSLWVIWATSRASSTPRVSRPETSVSLSSAASSGSRKVPLALSPPPVSR